MTNLWWPALFVASAAITATAATLAVGETAFATVTAGPSASAAILALLAVAAPALAFVTLRPAVATVVTLPLRLSRRLVGSSRRSAFGRRCSRSVGRSSSLDRLRRALLGVRTPVVLASVPARTTVLFPLMPMPARPPDFLELLFLGLGNSCRVRRRIRCSAGFSRWLFGAHRRGSRFHGRFGCGDVGNRLRHGNLGSAATAGVSASSVGATSTIGATLVSDAGAGCSTTIVLTGRFSDLKPSARSTLPNSSGEQPRIDIMSGVTVKAPSPVDPFGGMTGASGLARQASNGLIWSASRSRMSKRTARGPHTWKP